MPASCATTSATLATESWAIWERTRKSAEMLSFSRKRTASSITGPCFDLSVVVSRSQGRFAGMCVRNALFRNRHVLSASLGPTSPSVMCDSRSTRKNKEAGFEGRLTFTSPEPSCSRASSVDPMGEGP